VLEHVEQQHEVESLVGPGRDVLDAPAATEPSFGQELVAVPGVPADDGVEGRVFHDLARQPGIASTHVEERPFAIEQPCPREDTEEEVAARELPRVAADVAVSKLDQIHGRRILARIASRV
jgi:hypothetical protein